MSDGPRGPRAGRLGAVPILRRLVGPSVRALSGHRGRSLLVIGAVGIGVASLVTLSGVAGGSGGEVLRNVEGLNGDLLVVRPAEVKRLVTRRTVRGLVTSLTMEDVEALEHLDGVALVAPGAETMARVKAGRVARATRVLGTSPSYAQVRRFRVRRGRFLRAADDQAASRVAVLGARVAETLFGAADPVGETIRVRGIPFDVVGVLEPKGALAASDEDDQVVVPVRTALRRLLNRRFLGTVYVAVREPAEMDAVERRIAARLDGRHARKGDFTIQNQARIVSMQREARRTLTLVASSLAATGLLLGGFGILALMLISVKERTVEIGLALAVGATPGLILGQFLVESAALALGGWLTGILSGLAGCRIASSALGWGASPPATALVSSLGVTLVAGLAFGALPAWAASRVTPIEALGSA